MPFRVISMACAFVFVAVACVVGVDVTALAQSPPPVGVVVPLPADCSIVSQAEAAEILGYPVESADASSQAGGICFFTSRAISQDGSLTYAIVTAANLPQRRSFAAAQARRCAGVVKVAPNAIVCRTYADVALAVDLDAYFKARTAATDAMPVKVLGVDAVAAPGAIYVRRGDYVIEAVVRRGETLDIPRATTLAKLLLARMTK